MDIEMSHAEEGNDMVPLLTSDGKIFEVEKAVALQSVMISKVIEDLGTQIPIPLIDISSQILEKVIEYCKYHVDHPPRLLERADDIDEWDVQFLNVDRSTLAQIGMASHFLDVRSLSRLLCKNIAEMIQSFKTPERVREEFNLPNDLPPEVQEQIRNENRWAFED